MRSMTTPPSDSAEVALHVTTRHQGDYTQDLVVEVKRVCKKQEKQHDKQMRVVETSNSASAKGVIE